jgi:quercetin dioxygenase-like cupin family protein
MEKFLHPMFLFDAILPFGAGMLFCLWQLWELKKENAKAAAAKAALAATQGSTLAAPSPVAAPAFVPPSPPLDLHMSDVRHIAWESLEIEEMTPLIGRRLIYTEKQMLAHVYLKQGAIVPAHDHINEQLTYIISGALRFWIGEHADNPGDTYVDVRAGEVLVIPSSVRHRAEALEDTLDVDIFNPPRQDWIEKTDAYLRTGVPMTGSR